jgi:hypothetical protein
MPPDVITSPK